MSRSTSSSTTSHGYEALGNELKKKEQASVIKKYLKDDNVKYVFFINMLLKNVLIVSFQGPWYFPCPICKETSKRRYSARPASSATKSSIDMQRINCEWRDVLFTYKETFPFQKIKTSFGIFWWLECRIFWWIRLRAQFRTLFRFWLWFRLRIVRFVLEWHFYIC